MYINLLKFQLVKKQLASYCNINLIRKRLYFKLFLKYFLGFPFFIDRDEFRFHLFFQLLFQYWQ